MKVFLKPCHLLEINGEHFLFKLKSLRHEKISAREAELLGQVAGKIELDADEEMLELLQRHRLIAQSPWDEEKVTAQLVEAYRSRGHMDLIVEVRVKEGGDLLREVAAIPSVEEASLLSHDGETTF